MISTVTSGRYDSNEESLTDLIRRLENERYAAMLASDTVTLDRLLSARLVCSHSNAERDTKTSYLERVRDGTFVYESIDHPEERIIIADGAAVVVGTTIAKVYRSGEVRTLRNGSCAVWMNEDGNWRLVAYQPTPIAT